MPPSDLLARDNTIVAYEIGKQSRRRLLPRGRRLARQKTPPEDPQILMLHMCLPYCMVETYLKERHSEVAVSALENIRQQQTNRMHTLAERVLTAWMTVRERIEFNRLVRLYGNGDQKTVLSQAKTRV